MDLRRTGISLLRGMERYTKTDMVYLASSGFWTNAGTVFISLASFLLYITFGHFLSKEVYGTYQYLLSIGAIIGALTLTGMNAAVTRAVVLGHEGSVHVAMKLQLRWSIVPLTVAWIAGGYYLFAGNLVLGLGLVLIGMIVPINNSLNTYGAYLQGKHDFKRGFLYSLWWNVPYYLSVGIAAVYAESALLLLAANLISQAIGLFIAYRKTLAAYPPNTSIDEAVPKYGAHLSVMGLLGSVAAQIDAILAFQLLGPAQLAIYSFATGIPDRIGALFKFLPAAALPKFTGRSPAEIRRTLAPRLLIGVAASTVLAFIYILIASPIYNIFFPAYTEAISYSQWYALTLIALMSGVISNALIAHANIRTLYMFNIVNPLAQISLQVTGIMLFGLAGLIGARVVASIFTFCLSSFLYWRTT